MQENTATIAHRLVTPSAFAPDVPGNAGVTPTPAASPGRAAVPYDFAGVRVGTAEYPEGPTGVTVLHVPAGARTAVDARGGAVGVSGGYEFNHAICFSGGSVYGMGASAGVTDSLLGEVRNRTSWEYLRLVSGAVIYDFSPRDNAISPDAALGAAALRNAVDGSVQVGRCGAGRSATVGKLVPERAEYAGQGAAFGVFGGVKVLVVTVVNAVGVVVGRDGAVVRGNYDRDSGERRHPARDYAELIGSGPAAAVSGNPPASGNTTLTALVTNARLTDIELTQLARQVHGSMNRGIQPFHTQNDGDVLFALTTDEADLTGVKSSGLGTLAAEVAWDAVLSSAE